MAPNFNKLKEQIGNELRNKAFYLPLTFSTFVFDGRHDFMQNVYHDPPNDMSTVAANKLETTRITENNEKECQICGNGYKNGRHHQLFAHRNSCCICRMQYQTEGELVQHRNEFVNAHICCKCQKHLTGNQTVDAKHFKECSLKRKTKSVLQIQK